MQEQEDNSAGMLPVLDKRVTFTQEDIRNGVAAQFGMDGRAGCATRALMVLLGCTGLAVGFGNTEFPGTLMLPAFLLLFGVMPHLAAWLRVRRMSPETRETHLKISEDAFHLKTGATDSRIGFADIHTAKFTEHTLVMRTTRNAPFILPRRILGESVEAFLQQQLADAFARKPKRRLLRWVLLVWLLLVLFFCMVWKLISQAPPPH